jgi:hypothetical protein
MDTEVQSRATFQDAERAYREAWANPAHTRFEFPPVDVNKVVRERYRATPAKRLTRASLWDMETKKAWDAMSYLSYVAREAHSWGRHPLSDGAERWCRASMQRGWIKHDEYGQVLEDIFISHTKQTVYFFGRARMTEPNGKELTASTFQPLFHVMHGVGGPDDEPQNLWSIVLLTDKLDPRYLAPFEARLDEGLPGFVEIYIQKDLGVQLTKL